jgi:hypothetical protein
MNAFNEAKKLTAGLVFESGKAWLGPEVLQVAVDNKRKREEQEQAVIQRQSEARNKRREASDAAWAAVAHLPTSRWSVQQLRALVNYKKFKTDKWPQLKTKAQLLQKWEEVKDHTAPVDRDVLIQPSERENEALIALLALVAGDDEDEEIEEYMV